MALVVKDFAVGALGLGFDLWAGQVEHSVFTVAMFLRSCVAQPVIRGDRSGCTLGRNTATIVKI